MLILGIAGIVILVMAVGGGYYRVRKSRTDA
jgi:hypothetical protein